MMGRWVDRWAHTPRVKDNTMLDDALVVVLLVVVCGCIVASDVRVFIRRWRAARRG